MEDLRPGTELKLFWTSRTKNIFWRAKLFWDEDTGRKYYKVLFWGISCSPTVNTHGCFYLFSLSLPIHPSCWIHQSACAFLQTVLLLQLTFTVACHKVLLSDAYNFDKLTWGWYFPVWACVSAWKFRGNLQSKQLRWFSHLSRCSVGQCWRHHQALKQGFELGIFRRVMDVSRNLLASIVNLRAAEKQTNTHLMHTMETSLSLTEKLRFQFKCQYWSELPCVGLEPGTGIQNWELSRPVLLSMQPSTSLSCCTVKL